MKKFKCIMSAAIAAVMLLSGNVLADSPWKSIMTENFDTKPDVSIPTDSITETNSLFSAQYKDKALYVKSDTMFSYTVEDHTDYVGNKNAHGIKLNYISDRIITSALEEPVTAYDHTYYYGSKGDNAICMVDNIAGKKAIKQATYINIDNGKFNLNEYYANPETYTPPAENNGLRTNYSRFAVTDKSMFDTNNNNYTVEIEYYTEDGDGNTMSLIYANNSSNSSERDWGIAKTIYDGDPATETPSPVTGAWTTASVTLTNADFSKMIEGSNSTGSVSFRIETSKNKVNYIHSVKIKKNNKAYDAVTGLNNTVQKKIADEPVYGNVKITYDMTLPTDSVYNTEKNIMSTGLTDSDGIEYATLIYEINGTSADVSALTASGSKTYVCTISDVIGKTLKHEVTTDMKGNTYSVKILDGETTVGEASAISVNGSHSDGYFRPQYINIKHNADSDAIISVIDNIDISMQEDDDYIRSDADAKAIDLGIFDKATSDFPLPVEGSINQSAILWESSDSSVIEIADGGTRAWVKRNESSDMTATLTAKVTYGGYTQIREIPVIVASLAGTKTEIGTLVTTDNMDGTINASVTVNNAKTSGLANITLVVASVNPSTGDIVTSVDTRPAPLNDYDPLTLTASGLSHTAGNELKYYLWGDNNISLVNNAPSPVSNLEVINKVKGVGLKWDPSFDDNNAISHYEIKRDGVTIAHSSGTAYTDTACSTLQNHTYTVVAVDTNDIKDTVSAEPIAGCTIPMPYYIVPVGTTEAEINRKGVGIEMVYEADTMRAIYNRDGDVADITGEVSDCREIPSGADIDAIRDIDRGIGFKLVNSEIQVANKVAIEFTYLDTEGTIFFQYGTAADPAGWKQFNIGTMTNTRTWKVASVVIEDGPIKQSSTLSNCFFIFGLRQGTQSSLYVKNVEMVEGSLYQ